MAPRKKAAGKKKYRARFELPARDPKAMVAETELEAEAKSSASTDPEPMTEEDLGAILDGQIQDAKDYDSSELIELREKALKYFNGEVDFAAPAGRSQVVSRDVADTHGLIMPSLMRVFLATDSVAIYNPATPADEEFARQATDYVNYVVLKECNGYTQFRSSFHDGLLVGNGPLKHWWDDTPTYSTESFTGLPDDAFTMLVNDPDVEVIEHSEYPDPSFVPPPPMPMMGPGSPMLGMPAGPVPQMPPEGGMPMPGMPPEGGMPMPEAPKLHDCKVKRVTSHGRLRLMTMAPEDLLLGRGTLALDEENCRFAAHRWRKTRSALIKEGHDPDKVNALPVWSGATVNSTEELAREPHRLREDGDNAPDKSTELVEGYECFLQCDYNGDGIAEWLKVNKVLGCENGNGILSCDEWGDDLPFSDIVPDPIPHRWRGRSLFDATEDIQRIKTVAMRQVLDNVYMTNAPRQVVLENGVVNPEQLQDFEIGTTIIEKTPNSVRYDVVPFVADKVYPILEYLDQVVEKRTGISQRAMALDMDTLSESTATAIRANQAAVHTKVEEYARNIAEYGGLRRVFSKILKLIVKHQDRERTVRIRDKWVTVDPRAWNSEMDVTINTGIGSGSREHDLTMLMGVATKQEQIVQQLGPVNPICGVDRLMDTYRLTVEAAGLKPAERFFPVIDQGVMQQLQQQMSQRQDPKVQMEQMRQGFEQQKMQMQAQLDKQAQDAKAQLDFMVAQHGAQMEQEKAAREAQMQQLQLERQAQVEERQAQADIATKQAEMQSKAKLAVLDADWKARLAQQQFAHEQRLAQQKMEHEQQLAREKFEFDKKIKLLDLYVKQRTAALKPDAEGNMPNAPARPELDIDVDNILAGEGMDMPAESTFGRGPMQALADSHSHLADTLAQSHSRLAEALSGLGQKFSDGHAQLSGAIVELSKPKRKRVLRDERNQVVGSEDY